MIVHFFRERTKERIDFYQLVDGYFDSLKNCTINSNDEEVLITIELRNFDFKYNFKITKRCQILSIYRLNSEYININLLCEIPCMLPQYLSRIIFKQINDICDKFDLAIYFDQLENIQNFDMFSLISGLGKERVEYLSDHPETETYKLPMNVLNDLCQYQSMIDVLPNLVKNDVAVYKYNVLCDKKTREVKMSISWKAGTPSIFPPNLDYVQVIEEENLVAVIPIEVFYKYILKFMYEIKDDSINFKLLYLNEKGAMKAKKLLKKMHKAVVYITDFEQIKITELTEC